MNTESVNDSVIESPDNLNTVLADFGAPRGVAKPYASARPFVEALSGRDPLRVMRAARDADDERDPYGWWTR